MREKVWEGQYVVTLHADEEMGGEEVGDPYG